MLAALARLHLPKHLLEDVAPLADTERAAANGADGNARAA